MKGDHIPQPSVMPVDRVEWAKQLDLSNFVNTYYQYRDLQTLSLVKTVLVIGPGQGLDTHVLKWRGYDVQTFDIDATFAPDHLGSVHSMDMFSDRQFDAVIASHVLEHLAVPYLDRSLNEIARVGRYALIYLPIAGRHAQMRFIPGFKGIDLSFIADVYNYFHRPDGVTARYCEGMHFWEIGMRGFRLRDIIARLARSFEVISVYRNRDWPSSHNFVLKSRSVVEGHASHSPR